MPVVFIVGVPRSGTTLLYQLMCRHLDVGYVSNTMARWWMVPVAAARIRSPLRRQARETTLVSDLGRSNEPDGPHEFGWFWQFHLLHEDTDDLASDTLEDRDFGAAKAELEGLAGYFERPLVLKALVHVPYKIAWLKKNLPQARFIWIHRDPTFVAQSIIEARQDRFGDPTRWWSVRPRDVAQWRSRPPVEQVAHQIIDVTEAIERGFVEVGPDATLHVEYDQLVRQPEAELRRIADFCGAKIHTGTGLSELELASRNEIRLPPNAHQALEKALLDAAKHHGASGGFGGGGSSSSPR
jgi:hypothetical protein